MHTIHILSALCFAASALAASGAEPLWRATKQTVYEPSERNPSQLVKSYDAEFKFDAEGREIEEVQTPVSGTKMLRTSAYNSAGRLASQEVFAWSGGRWVLYSSKTREYDDLTGAVTVSEDYTYENGEKLPGNCFHRQINRDDAGNVVGVQVSVLYNGVYDPIQRISFTYGADGKPADITELSLTADANGSFTWVLGQRYSDLVWADFNGQIASVDDLYHGNNRLASGHYINDNGTKPYDNFDIAATYSGNDVTVVQTGMYQGIENSRITIVQTEETTADGVVSYSTTTSYADLAGEYPTENYIDTNVFDTWGHELESSEYYWEGTDGERELVFLNTTEVIYDPTYGYPLEATERQDGMELARIVYSGYSDLTPLSETEASIRGGADVYHDLLGRRLNGPQKGIYIHNGKKIIN